MAEPPHVWAAPGDEPDDRDAWGNPPVATPLPKPASPPPTGTEPPAPTDPTRPVPGTPPPGTPGPPPGAPTPGQGQPNWGAPPEQGRLTGWGAPPSQPNQWGGQPTRSGGQPSQWGGQPNQWGAPPGQWGGQPNPGGGQWGGPPPGGGPPQWGGPTGPGNWSNRGPGIVPLRPLAIGEIYDGAIRAIRANPRTMVGFSAIVISVLTLLGTIPQAYALSALLNSPLADPDPAQTPELSDFTGIIGAGSITLLVALLQFIIASTILSGLLIVAVDGAVRGQAFTPGQLWARCRSRLVAIVGLALAIPIAQFLVLLVTLIPGLIVIFVPSGRIAGVILLILGALTAFVISFALYLGFWAVGAPALLLENLGVIAALRRSFRLVRGSFWRVFGISLLTAIIAYIIRQLFRIPFAIIGGLVSALVGGDGFSTTLIQLLITDIGTVLAGAVLFPFTAGVAALLYLDLRMRKEGLDVDLMRS